MTTLIIICAVILILGSSLWILPSPRQRAQMELRRTAMRKGLQVKLSKIKDLEYPGEEKNCIAYRLPRHRTNDVNTPKWMLLRHTQTDEELQVPGWIYERVAGRYRFSDGEAIAKILAQFPADVMAVQSTSGSVSAYWNENGEMEDVDTLLRVLTELQAG
jgi:hypothetical protein